eukprot:scaffold195679_cov29-Tisochrysis_lutea.AAC.6
MADEECEYSGGSGGSEACDSAGEGEQKGREGGSEGRAGWESQRCPKLSSESPHPSRCLPPFIAPSPYLLLATPFPLPLPLSLPPLSVRE